jgi:hypothetical protein
VDSKSGGGPLESLGAALTGARPSENSGVPLDDPAAARCPRESGVEDVGEQ